MTGNLLDDLEAVFGGTFEEVAPDMHFMAVPEPKPITAGEQRLLNAAIAFCKADEDLDQVFPSKKDWTAEQTAWELALGELHRAHDAYGCACPPDLRLRHGCTCHSE